MHPTFYCLCFVNLSSRQSLSVLRLYVKSIQQYQIVFIKSSILSCLGRNRHNLSFNSLIFYNNISASKIFPLAKILQLELLILSRLYNGSQNIIIFNSCYFDVILRSFKIFQLCTIIIHYVTRIYKTILFFFICS